MRFIEKALERLWFSCGGHCHTHTDGGASCPLLDGADPMQRLLDPEARRFSSGFALVAACAAVFLLPLATAAGGAFLAGKYLAASAQSEGLWQMAGILAGLAAGIGLAKLLLFLTRSKKTLTGGGEQ